MCTLKSGYLSLFLSISSLFQMYVYSLGMTIYSAVEFEADKVSMLQNLCFCVICIRFMEVQLVFVQFALPWNARVRGGVIF